MKQEAMVVMLPTISKEYAILHKAVLGILYPKLKNEHLSGEKNHLYITVPQEIEPIKEGDWVYWADPEGITSDINQVVSVNEEMIFMSHPEHSETEALPNECSKIIATTDKKLKLKQYSKFNSCCRMESECHCNIPQLQQSFVKEYCKRGVVDKVMVEYKYNEDSLSEYNKEVDYKGHSSINLEDDLQLNLNQDNTINISFIEEKMYSEAFVLWYSGMELEKIKLAHKRWKKETNN